MRDEIKKLIKVGENKEVEFKESLSLKGEIGETISAFSNANKGIILIGVGDKKEIKGVEIGKKTIEGLANFIKQNTDNNVYPDISVERVDDKDIIIIKVNESDEKPVFFRGKAYKRVGKSNHKLSASEIRKLAKESGKKVYWDEQVCEGAGLEDIDEEKIKWFLKEARKQRGLNIFEDVNLEESLMRLNLLKDGKLTNALVLLFGKEPQKFFMQSEIKCIRFKGIDVTGEMLDFKVIKEDIITQLKKVEDFIFEHIPKKAWIEEGKLQRQEKWLYPQKAIREVLANALAHRDYETTGKVQIRIFDDRMEIWNPGELPYLLTFDDLKKTHKSIPRNPLLSKVFFWIKYVEEVGTGTNKIVKWSVDWGLPEPDFKHITGDFVVIFWKSKFTDELLKQLNERQIKAVDFLKEYHKITNKDFQKLCPTVTRETLRKDLKDIIDRGIITQKGTKRGVYYELA